MYNHIMPELQHQKDQSIMVLIPAGKFLMGSSVEEEAQEFHQSNISNALKIWFLAATPRHEKHVNQFYLDKFPVTNRQFTQFVSETGYRTEAEISGYGWRWHIPNQKWKRASGWHWKQPAGEKGAFPTGPDYPVVHITWQDAVQYCRWTGKRLPTEAEWEYACRAGTNTRYFWGEDPNYDYIGQYAWYIGNAENKTQIVGQKWPNAWGLHDMCGNAWEWVSDQYVSYPGSAYQIQQSGKNQFVQRGGAWYFHPTYLRSSYRGSTIKGNFVGFRCAMDSCLNGATIEEKQ